MNIQLSEHFDYKKLLLFTLPSIVMMIFTSIYSVVDGFFVSNFVGKAAFTAVNFIMPVLMILGTVGFMFGTGGSALIARTMGEGRDKEAQRIFSLIVYVSMVLGVALAIIGQLILRPVAVMMHAEGELLQNCLIYGRIILLALPAYILQFEFQCLFVTANKPKLGLIISICAGLTNMVLDALFMAVFHWGLPGAAIATAISQCVGGLLPLIYFGLPNSSRLRLGATGFSGSVLGRVCINGSSELMSNIAMSTVSALYNMQLLKYAGPDGVSAYGVLMYVGMIFMAIFMGYSVGVAPVVSYHFGAENHSELHNLLARSLRMIAVCGVAMVTAAHLLATPLGKMFVGYDEELLALTLHAFSIYSWVFLLAGFTIFGSGFFTALNNGLISAAISFLRTLVFEIGAVLILPLFWETDGIWFSMVAAELMAITVTTIFLLANRRRYQY